MSEVQHSEASEMIRLGNVAQAANTIQAFPPSRGRRQRATQADSSGSNGMKHVKIASQPLRRNRRTLESYICGKAQRIRFHYLFLNFIVSTNWETGSLSDK